MKTPYSPPLLRVCGVVGGLQGLMWFYSAAAVEVNSFSRALGLF